MTVVAAVVAPALASQRSWSCARRAATAATAAAKSEAVIGHERPPTDACWTSCQQHPCLLFRSFCSFVHVVSVNKENEFFAIIDVFLRHTHIVLFLILQRHNGLGFLHHNMIIERKN